MRKSMHIASLLVGAAVFGGVAMPTWAVDGVVLIDQNKALAGGVSPGDAPGFPVTISLAGSYRLAGNLTVPDANTNAIVIAHDNVTLDLNGFAILGPTDCSGGLQPCANDGAGMGISTDTNRFNITIRNGTVQGMGGRGIFLLGNSHLVEYVHARSNGREGIFIFPSTSGPGGGGSIAQHNTAHQNGSIGIIVDQGLVSHNTVDRNIEGIRITGAGSASYNVVTDNVFDGLELGCCASYIGNVLSNNSPSVTGGVNLGQNLCFNAACP
jgi:hypothetical protein